MSRTRKPVTSAYLQLRVCRGCKCDDLHACLDDDGADRLPCSWNEVFADGTGICSRCARIVANIAARSSRAAGRRPRRSRRQVARRRA